MHRYTYIYILKFFFKVTKQEIYTCYKYSLFNVKCLKDLNSIGFWILGFQQCGTEEHWNVSDKIQKSHLIWKLCIIRVTEQKHAWGQGGGQSDHPPWLFAIQRSRLIALWSSRENPAVDWFSFCFLQASKTLPCVTILRECKRRLGRNWGNPINRWVFTISLVVLDLVGKQTSIKSPKNVHVP